MPKTAVIMATYNGENYISDQIESILNQSEVYLKLFIFDDGSSDNTVSICQEYQSRYPDIISVYRNKQNLGVSLNFIKNLLRDELSGFDFYAFSDQDDYWLPEKISIAQDTLKRAKHPALYYSNVINTDSDLNNGILEYPKYNALGLDKGVACVANTATGCTMVFNSALRDVLAQRVPESFPRLHDTWVYFVALFFGEVHPHLDHSYILRRIGENNLEGCNRRQPVQFICSRIWDIFKHKYRISSFCRVFLDEYADLLDTNDIRQFEQIAQARHSVRSRIRLLFNKSIKSVSPLGTAVFKIKVFLGVV